MLRRNDIDDIIGRSLDVKWSLEARQDLPSDLKESLIELSDVVYRICTYIAFSMVKR